MTYEQQRSLRERERGERIVDRFSADNYATKRRSSAPTHASGQSSKQGRGDRSGYYRGQRNSQQAAPQRSRREQLGATPSTRSSESADRGRKTTIGQLSRQNYEATAPKRLPVFKIGVAIILVIFVVFAVKLCSSVFPITVTINGTDYELHGSKTMQTALSTSGLPINPGDYISLNGNVLEKSAGKPFKAEVNGTETADPNYQLHNGDAITITDGDDIVEEYTSTESPIAYEATITGTGAVHAFTTGSDGTLETRVGVTSGETIEVQSVNPQNAVCQQYNIDPGGNKVIAFTFDDGPSSEYTAQVLDILKQNDVKATFFCIGTQVEANPELLRREVEEGHQVCTHSYDHAKPAGGTNIGFMDKSGQIEEIQKGYQTIADALGIGLDQVSRVVRMPGGNLSEEMVMNLSPYISYEIGWNIDTQDWSLPGEDVIYEAMISADSGEILLCHDGGGDRSQTVAALERAIPYLKAKGYTFVTVDELLKYPAA